MSHQERKAALRQRYERLRKAIPVELEDGLTLHVRPLMIDERDYIDQLQEAKKERGKEDEEENKAMIAAWIMCEEDGARLSDEERKEYAAIFETGSAADYMAMLNAAVGAAPQKSDAKAKDADAGN